MLLHPGTGGVEQTGGAPGTGGAGGATSVACDRAGLQAAADSYRNALEAGTYAGMPLAAAVSYVENGETVAIDAGIWQMPMTLDRHIDLLDVEACETFSEVIIAGGSHPYVLGVRLTATGEEISGINVIATDADDWGFDATNYLTHSAAETWGPIDPAEQPPRADLEYAAHQYFEYWIDNTADVPWGDPCARLEGGMYTGDVSLANGSCSVGIPNQGFAPPINDYLFDPDQGMVVAFLNMPGPDSHMFHVTNSHGIRYIHTLTICYVNGEWQCPGDPPS